MQGPFKAEWPIQQFGDDIKNGKIGFENTKQRGIVWNKLQKSLLIDSVVAGYPMGNITAVLTEEDDYDILDGKQRLTTIYDYVNGGFKIAGLKQTKFKDGSVDINGKSFIDLEQDVQNKILTYVLTMEYFRDASEDEEKEIFKRLNNGKSLTAVEKIRAESSNYDQIRELANHNLFELALSKLNRNSFVDEDIVIKTYLLVCKNDFDLQTKSVREVMRNVSFTEDEIKQMTRVFDVLKDVLEKVKADKSQKKSFTKIKKKTNLLSIVKLTDDVLKDKKNNRGPAVKAVFEWVIKFFGADIQDASIDETYNELIQKGSSKPENVEERIRIVGDNFNQ